MKGLVIGNTHMKYESSIFNGWKVMAKVSFCPRHQRRRGRGRRRRPQGCDISSPDIRPGSLKTELIISIILIKGLWQVYFWGKVILSYLLHKVKRYRHTDIATQTYRPTDLCKAIFPSFKGGTHMDAKYSSFYASQKALLHNS